MPISFTCPGCGEAYRVSDHLAGRKAKCRQCGGAMKVPAPPPSSSPPPLPTSVATAPAPGGQFAILHGMIPMCYEEHYFKPDIFTKVLVDYKHLARIVAYCEGEAVSRIGFDGIERALRDFMNENVIRKATYGIVVNSAQIGEADIRNCVSNFTKGRLTCVWVISVNETEKTFFGCHSVFKVNSTPIFESECQNQINRGLCGVGERKKYALFLEMLFKCNPVLALSVYKPRKVIAKMSRTKYVQ